MVDSSECTVHFNYMFHTVLKVEIKLLHPLAFSDEELKLTYHSIRHLHQAIGIFC